MIIMYNRLPRVAMMHGISSPNVPHPSKHLICDKVRTRSEASHPSVATPNDGPMACLCWYRTLAHASLKAFMFPRTLRSNRFTFEAQRLFSLPRPYLHRTIATTTEYPTAVGAPYYGANTFSAH